MGTIITATSSQKTTIMLPRLSRFGEHRNDHQNSTAEKFKDRVGLYFVETDKELYNYLDIRDSLLKPNNVNQVSLDLMKTLEDFINN
jgi:UDP-N-acetylglucosamine transferase subunit ALG13